MKRILILILITVTLSQISYAQSGREILDETLETIGGKEKLRSVESSTLKFIALNSFNPDTSFTVTKYKGESFLLKSHIKFDSINIIWDGTKGWMKGEILKSEDWSPINQNLMRQMSQFIFQKELLFSELISSLPDSVNVDYIGKNEFNGIDCKEIHINPFVNDKGVLNDITLLIGEKDNLIYKYVITYDLRPMGGTTTTVEVTLNDYKKVSDLLLPHSIELAQMKATFNIIYSDIDLESEVSSSLFEDPMK